MRQESSSRIQAYEIPTPAIESKIEARAESARRSRVWLPVVAIAVAIVVSIALVSIPQPSAGVNVNGGTRSAEVKTATTSGLLASMEVKDENGIPIPSGGISESDTITFSGYYSAGYTLDLRCSIDGFPLYCDGSGITIPGLPTGLHKIVIMESSNPGASPLSFTWTIK